MSVSVFDLFRIGVGPSSSHTVGPMLAAAEFVDCIRPQLQAADVRRVKIELFGSLSATGVGHATDKAIIVGLMGQKPDSVDPQMIQRVVEDVKDSQRLELAGDYSIEFDWQRDLLLLAETLPYHSNAVRMTALGEDDKELYQNTWYSIGGGFIINDRDVQAGAHLLPQTELPYDFNSAAELLSLCEQHDMRISELMMQNEKVWRSENQIRDDLKKIWQTMQVCIDNGLQREGTLPGGLKVKRRAMALHKSLTCSDCPNVISSTLNAMEWVNLYALAVNEENAAGGRMVTAPTNGAAGIIPAVLMYFMQFNRDAIENHVVDFFLVAGAIGILCKKNASISGAEVGCQGEVGSACAMAAAGLCEVLGGTPQQVENAAEIGLEHNLGLTCDPVGGLVQVPCIERNAIAAVKAINATQMALRGDGTHFVSLDKVIKTMLDTGKDMQEKYKETSRGGLAVNAIEC